MTAERREKRNDERMEPESRDGSSAKHVVPVFFAVLLVASTLLPNPPWVPAASTTTTIAGMTGLPRGEESGWVRVRNTDGIVLSRRLGLKGFDHSMRAQAEVTQPLLVVAGFLVDVERVPEWVARLAKLEVLRSEGDTEYLLRAALGPKTQGDRSVALAAKLAVHRTPTRLVADLQPTRDSEWSADGRTQEPPVVSLELAPLDGGRRTRITVTLRCDPSRPDERWCADLSQPDTAFAMMSAFRAAVSKGGIEVSPRLKELVEEGDSAGGGNGPSYERALASNSEAVTVGAAPGSRDLTQAELAAPLSQAPFLTHCGASDQMTVVVRAAVRSGRPVGVTVTTDPPSANVASCIDRAVRGLRWAASPKTDFVTTSY